MLSNFGNQVQELGDMVIAAGDDATTLLKIT